MKQQEWFALPLHLRQRYWKETDYGEKPPTPELQALIDKALGKGGGANATEDQSDVRLVARGVGTSG